MTSPPELAAARLAGAAADFPILDREMRNGRRLVYLDSGATSQKPRQVLDAERAFYEQSNSAAHRSAHQLSVEATTAYEGARATVASFLGADHGEVVFTRSATESLNVVTHAMTPSANELALRPGDEVVITEMEHHANILPWQQVCARTGATLRWFDVTDDGRLDLSALDSLVNDRTRVVALTQQSNVLGTINPVAVVAARAHEVGAVVVVDAAQSVPHMPVDAAALGADVLVFSGHKMCGPSGIGVLWVRRELIDQLPPLLTGGSMVEHVTMTSATFRVAPHHLEAGVPATAQAVGLAAAVDYLGTWGMDVISAHSRALAAAALRRLSAMHEVRVIGPMDGDDRGGTVTFVVDGLPAHRVGHHLDELGVAVRIGQHCAQPLHQRFGLPATVRASFYLYNTSADVDALVGGVEDLLTRDGRTRNAHTCAELERGGSHVGRSA
ncbi:SufS family cysteine desulfurase [Amycolatopsis sp. cmx-4-61]|uniref:SufS family cysteine desulfurase n=1 Tax=Amycolatopsis sp. cmx-4-61 TaxID=2790937 RepID=UPI0039781756